MYAWLLTAGSTALTYFLITLCHYRFDPVRCPSPWDTWPNNTRFRGTSCRVPDTALHHGILLCQHIHGRKQTQRPHVPDVSNKSRLWYLTLISTSDRSDYFHTVCCLLFLLDTLYSLHAVYDREAGAVPGCVCARLWFSFILVCFSKQLYRSLCVWSQEPSHKKTAVFIVLRKTEN